METIELVKHARQGDQDALVKLIMSRKQEYYKLAYAYMQNREDAMDAMEDMIVLLYENIGRLKKEEAFHSWSKTILVNCCKNLLRKRKRFVSLETAPEESCEGGFGSREDRLLLEEQLAKLAKGHQEVLKLRYFLGLDYQSIADMLKIPLGTVKSRIAKGLGKLKTGLGGEGA